MTLAYPSVYFFFISPDAGLMYVIYYTDIVGQQNVFVLYSKSQRCTYQRPSATKKMTEENKLLRRLLL
jgi:hypothetical protein